MGWKCTDCGIENQDSTVQCLGCGGSLSPLKVTFVSRNSGKSHPVSIKNEPGRNMIIGRDILRILNDPDLKYVDKFQFRLEEVYQKGILIKPVSFAKNKVFINDNLVPEEGVLLGNNDLLSINGKFFFLELKIS